MRIRRTRRGELLASKVGVDIHPAPSVIGKLVQRAHRRRAPQLLAQRAEAQQPPDG